MKTILISEGQTLEDIAIQEYGAEEAVIIILQDNDLSMDSQMYAGRLILIKDEVPEINENNRAIAKYFKDNKIKPNCGIVGVKTEEEYVEDDYWDDDYVE